MHGAERARDLVGKGARPPGVRVVVAIAGEELVRPFARQHRLDVSACKGGGEVSGKGAPHDVDIHALEVIDHSRQGAGHVVRGEDELMVVGADVLGDAPRRLQVRASRGADREGLERTAARTCRKCGDD